MFTYEVVLRSGLDRINVFEVDVPEPVQPGSLLTVEGRRLQVTKVSRHPAPEHRGEAVAVEARERRDPAEAE